MHEHLTKMATCGLPMQQGLRTMIGIIDGAAMASRVLRGNFQTHNDVHCQENVGILPRSRVRANSCPVASSRPEAATSQAVSHREPRRAGLRQQQLQHEHHAAASNSHLREARPKPRGHNAYDQRRRTSKRRIRRREDCREGHHSKRHVRYVLEKRPQEPVGDRPPDERERQDLRPSVTADITTR